MNTNIKTTNIVLSPAISDYVTKRLEKIEKIMSGDQSARCDVELAKTTDHHQKGEIFRAEIHIIGKNLNIYVSSEKNDLFTAIDSVKDETLQELISKKGKKISLIRRSGTRVKNILKGLWPWGKSE
ncbi:MAG: ribosome-associated translation inhibitor RaiA [Candidatus Paceibacterota bacterium]|jgi:ribosomal subunit interface protein